MTKPKDTKQAKDKNVSGSGDIFHRHNNRAIKVAVFVMAVMCGALIAIIICMSNPPNTSQSHTAVILNDPILNKTEHKSMADACSLNKNNCTVECQNTSSIYHDAFEALQKAQCEEELRLYINNQYFPNSMIENRWIPTHKTINEIVIINSIFTYIQNEAFNCVDFTKTKVLMLLGVDLSVLNNGVLLGLSQLRTLNIIGKVGQINRCFFQPVQFNLKRLKVSAGLEISGNKNVFGISYLPNLENLDISENTISGSLSRSFFLAVPNVQCLTISNSKITSIDEDAFEDIADNLHILDLSNNHLTFIHVSSIEQILALGYVNMYLLGNYWYCNCDLKPLIDLYDKYEDRLADIPYCKAPLSLYGVLFKNVTFDSECDLKDDSELMLDTTVVNMQETEPISGINIISSTVKSPAIVMPTTEIITINPLPFQMRCLSVIQMPSEAESLSSERMEYFLFAPPCYEFELILLNNNSVQVVVIDADKMINIVWFSEAVENFVYTIDDITVDYNCEGYIDPYLIIDNLQENYTYTFCIVPSGQHSITPFNCLPLHVPNRINSDDSIWISTGEKQFAIGIVCLIFFCSMLLGGVFAYFGIKSCPDLLEGSRHVLVVKKSEPTCYVSTITEGEYMDNQMTQKNSMKCKSSLNKIPSIKFNSIPTPSAQISSLPPPLLPLKKREELTDESLREADDHYELPCIYNKTHKCQLKCIQNKNEMSPGSPPPLPKRNSDVLLYSSTSELIPERPKMSF